jgi:hypothetical protein
MDTEVSTYIDDFPTYGITNYGRVINFRTGRDMILSPTMHGDLTVGLTRGGHQYRYSVKVLVARAYVPGETDEFNTPIQKDGDKLNLAADNIVWRPRWFALRYARQFTNPPQWYFFGPIKEVGGPEYETYMDAAIHNGILCSDIRDSIYNEKPVFPTGQMFIYLRK